MTSNDERVDGMEELTPVELFAAVLKALKKAKVKTASAVIRADGSVAVVVSPNPPSRAFEDFGPSTPSGHNAGPNYLTLTPGPARTPARVQALPSP